MEDAFNISKWKMTSIFWQMEDDLNMWTYKRQPQCFWHIEDNIKM